MRDMQPAGFALRLYMLALACLEPVVFFVLRRRLARGKEHPLRWREKLGLASAPRPPGRLIWLHAVGLGEVLALRGIIRKLSQHDPDLSFLVTSSTRQSAEVFGRNLPPKTIHQFLPMDVPRYNRRFLRHWLPNLTLWSEQDLWPSMVYECDDRAIPQAIINARMNARAMAARRWARWIYADLYRRLALISAQDKDSATHLMTLGATTVRVDGSIKPLPAQTHDTVPDAHFLSAAVQGRFVWVVCPSHMADEQVAFAAHAEVLRQHPNALLVIVPRFIERGDAIAVAAHSAGYLSACRSKNDPLSAATQVYIADTLGEAGFWYAHAQAALIGGGFDAIQGHNPWEAVHARCPVLHGPNTENFKTDYVVLDDLGGARLVSDARSLAQALTHMDRDCIIVAQAQAVDHVVKPFDKLCQDLLALLD